MTPHLLRLALALALLPLASHAFAAREDRKEPVNIEADKVSVDDRNKVHTFEGKVHLTQGSLILNGDKLIVTQDAGGFQHGVSWGSPDRLAYFSERRDGRDDRVEGRALRIEYDSRTERAKLFGNATVKTGGDEVHGDYIEYDGLTDKYAVNTSNVGETKTQAGGRVKAVILPKAAQPAPATQENSAP